MVADDFLADRQTKAGTCGVVVGAAVVREHIEYRLALAGLDTRPLVADQKLQHAAGPLLAGFAHLAQAHADHAAPRAVADRIGQQVEHHAMHQAAIELPGHHALAINGQADGLFGQRRFDLAAHILKHRVQIVIADIQHKAAVFQAGQFQDIVEQSGQALGADRDVLQIAPHLLVV